MNQSMSNEHLKKILKSKAQCMSIRYAMYIILLRFSLFVCLLIHSVYWIEGNKLNYASHYEFLVSLFSVYKFSWTV